MDLQPIADLSLFLTDPTAQEVDVSVFNGVVNIVVKEWDKVAFKVVFSKHIVCDSHVEAVLIADTLNTFINKRAYR